MLTANRFHQFLNSAREWEALMKNHLDSKPTSIHRIASDDGTVVFEIDIPGFEREDLDVEVNGTNLMVRAERHSEVDDSNINWKIRERLSGSEAYRFELPFRIDPEQTDVNYEHGVLRLKIQKPAEELPRKLTVQ
ncbi:Hsp20/alpha crystallin family protein [Thalassoglobus sp.]|uniref:Hsp20/alpha crystallin family protein n=1 Tax=Thalassoglobus sp. TaxID=2795869 RepID=UPI003AA7AACC